MQTGQTVKYGEDVLRALSVRGGSILVIDCLRPAMPYWIEAEKLEESCTEYELPDDLPPMDAIKPKQSKEMYKRWNCISGIVSFIADDALVPSLIKSSSDINHVSRQTIRRYLYKYLVYQDVRCLCPSIRPDKELTEDEKNYRWALNRFYYNRNGNTIDYAYTEMLRARYTDGNGRLKEDCPTFFQFRYFYRKYNDKQKELISRSGIKDYMKNHRPLLGDGVQSWWTGIGTGLLDSTICDLFLINERSEIIGRPIFTACIDGYSGMCLGYSLGWEGGTYGIGKLMENIVTDKEEHCRRFGIEIKKGQWNCRWLPTRFVTDKGKEYASENLEHMADLGIEIVNLESYRPELKGPVEKFFDVVQDYFKPYLKGRGTIESDYRERGGRDYRKDAALTLEQFETVMLRCILFYNCSRVLEDFPMTEEMLDKGVKPASDAVWNFMLDKGAELITADKEKIRQLLLPRTKGKFTRFGLKVGRLRYRNRDYNERFLEGGTVTVAYQKEDSSAVWLIEDGSYTKFTLIEKRYEGKSLDEIEGLIKKQKELVKKAEREKLQAKIDLGCHLEAIRGQTDGVEATGVKNIRAARKRERREDRERRR